jgi:hypothetical protein
MNNLGKYLIAYAVWAIGINTIDYFTPWLRKQEGGGWQKAESFPYWDNWSWTHIGWGALASLMGLSIPTFIVINAANELILEKALCHAADNIEAIKFSANCDPWPHIAADFTYGMIGYMVAKQVAPPIITRIFN